jgi:MEMO1 family protein
MEVRYPAVAGTFYPEDARELKETLADCLVVSPLGPRGLLAPAATLLGGMVPHAGYRYSGPCAAHFYASLESHVSSVVILGVNHRGRGAAAALSPADYWETPLGRVQVDQTLGAALAREVEFLTIDDVPHIDEHSIEVQLPFLQRRLKDFAFLPISLSHLATEGCARLGEAIARLYHGERSAGKQTALIASSDLSHYLSPRETERLDALVLEKVLSLDPVGLLETVAREDISMCGVLPTAVFLFAAQALGAHEARLLKHCHSGDAVPAEEVVGYASVIVNLRQAGN